ncbi:NAD(P)/FAD-dependent oxidoreductase [Roseateles sp. BYS180W]|uniref:NAD(P)/FAD-dependent oxidoreductase n=1 Tax=Roseateles rivi TaxID=3299028 RepID=A0ABW7FVS3_9BURK
MRILVVGAGLAGMTCAYELARQGHDVCVLERLASVASGASFAPEGLMSAAWVAARPHPELQAWSHWLSHPRWMWLQRQAQRKWAADSALLQLAQLGSARAAELQAAMKLEFEERHGMLLIWRDERTWLQDKALVQNLEQQGWAAPLLSPEACRALQPGLGEALPLHGGVLLPQERTGNTRQFVQGLRQAALQLGVRLMLRTEVTAIKPGLEPAVEVTTPEGAQTLRTDAVVVCAGQDSPTLLQSLGLHAPWLPLASTTLTVPLRQLEAHPELGPQGTVVDMLSRTVVTRLGQRIRVGGGNAPTPEASARTLQATLDTLFPGAQQPGSLQAWSTQRPTLPGGRPWIGNSGLPGVWLNTGHTEHGWLQTLGAASVLADLLAQRPSTIELQSFSPAAWSQPH